MNDWPAADIPTFYRSLDAVISPFIEAGFQLQIIDEPRPQDAYEEHYLKRYQDALQQPELLVYLTNRVSTEPIILTR